MSHVVFRTPDGRTHRLVHGDDLGRDPHGALVLTDPRVSGQHARVALRPDGLSLLALRGTLELDGSRTDEAVLERGQRWRLVEGVALAVVEVDHGTGAIPLAPTEGVEVDGLGLVVHFDTVSVTGAGLDEPVLLTGLKGLLVGALVRAGEPVHWHRLARQLWPIAKGQDPSVHKEAVRARWYQLTARVRKELEDAGMERPLFVTRSGTVHLALLPGDRVEDRSD